jgi:hypothetical protein
MTTGLLLWYNVLRRYTTMKYNLIGQKFGRLTVQKFSHKNKTNFWECLCECGKTSFVDTAHLLNGHSKSCGCYGQNLRRIHTLNEQFFENIDTEEKAYWLGFILADGNIHQNKRQFSLGIHKQDIEHLNKFKKHINSSHKIFYVENMCVLSLKNKQFCRHLINLGIIPKKSNVATAPILGENLYKHFWRGMIDGDGSVLIFKRKNKYSRFLVQLVGTFDVVNEFKKFVVRSGIQTKANPYKVVTSPNLFILGFEGLDITKKIVNILYSDSSIYLDRKYKTALSITET